jgi:hypothetical protein
LQLSKANRRVENIQRGDFFPPSQTAVRYFKERWVLPRSDNICPRSGHRNQRATVRIGNPLRR